MLMSASGWTKPLCRYITRPALANERVQINAAGQVVLKLKSAWRDGTTHIVMGRWSSCSAWLHGRPKGAFQAPVSRPRLHLIRFHGVLAPNAKLRAMVVPAGLGQEVRAAGAAAPEPGCAHSRPARISWARLLKRVLATT